MPTCVMSPSSCHAHVEHCSRPKCVITKCCMQVKERLDILGGIPRQVFAAPGLDPMDDVESALVNLKWENMVSGFTPEQVGSPETASHRLLKVSAPHWETGENFSLVVNSTAVM